ncbi:MAG: hypothetical protein U5K71_04470 [Gracilimonas sp.]|nr:hypothetical protein [Gracilimonas sp.]
MKKRKNIHEEVDKTLRSLDNIEPAKTDAFFYSRLTAKLENRKEKGYQLSGKTEFGFKLAVAAVLIMVSLNLISLIQFQPVTTDTAEAEATTENWAEEFTASYQVLDLGYYDNLEQE